MASTREYMDYLDEKIEIAPANSEEEYQASEVIAGILKDHGLETMVEGFDTHPAGAIFLPIFMCVMFVSLIVCGVTQGVWHYVALLVSALCAGLALFGHFTDNNVLANMGPASQSQNVVAVHRAMGDKVVKGARPIVIVAHYDTPRESLLRKGPLPRYATTLRRITIPMVLTIAVTIIVQAIPILPSMIRTLMWVISLLCCLPVIFVSVVDIYDHFAPCTPGSNDNKASVAALLSIANKVRPATDRVDDAVREGVESIHPRVGDQAVINPVPRLIQVVEETRGVRHGAEVLLSLGILPPSCDVVYEEPRVTVVEEGAVQSDALFEQEDPMIPVEENQGLTDQDYKSDGTDDYHDEWALDESDGLDEYEQEEQDVSQPVSEEDEEEPSEEELYGEESYDEEDYDEDYEEDYDDDDHTPSSLGVWFSERVTNIREFFSKNRGSDIDIDRGEDHTVENEVQDETEPELDELEGDENVQYEENPLEELEEVDETSDESELPDETADEPLDFDDELDDYNFEDLYPEELYLEEDASEIAQEDLAETDEEAYEVSDEIALEEPEYTYEPEYEEVEDQEAESFEEAPEYEDDAGSEAYVADESPEESVEVLEWDDEDEADARGDYDAEWIEDNEDFYVEDEQEVEGQDEAAPTFTERIKAFFRSLFLMDDEEGQEDVYEEDYEDYSEEEYEEEVFEDEAPVATYEPRHHAPLDSEVVYEEDQLVEDGAFVEDDLYIEENLEVLDELDVEEAYIVEDEDEPIEGDEPAKDVEPLVDPNVLHFDYEEEDSDILPRDTTGLDTISDSYDLYSGEVDRVAHRDRPQPVEDPSWGITSYQPPRPAMNIARRAALLDLPDPSEAFVDPLASHIYDYEPYTEEEYEDYESYDAQPYAVEMPEDEEQLEEETYEEVYEEVDEEVLEEVEEYVDDELLDDDEFVDEYEYVDESEEDDASQEMEEDPQTPSTGESIGEHKSFWGQSSSSEWKGGATRRADVREEDSLIIDVDDLQDAILELGDEYLVAHDIWFVATGASETNHAGIQAFVDAHRKDIRGAFLVNLDSIGAGSLALVVNEGLHTTRRADRRLVRMLSGIAQDLHIQLETAMMNWTDRESTITTRSRIRSVTVVGIDDNVLPAHSHTMDDVPERVDPRQVSSVVRMVTELIRRS